MVTAIVQITQFQSTPPVKAATNNAATNLLNITFQSTPPVKAATAKGKVIACPVEFQSTPPVKAATRTAFWSGEVRVISIHAAREGGDEQRLAKLEARLNISIHAAREGGDSLKTSLFRNILISIHAAREGGDRPFYFSDNLSTAFQSTPPVKAATIKLIRIPDFVTNFNPRRP